MMTIRQANGIYPVCMSAISVDKRILHKLKKMNVYFISVIIRFLLST